MQSIECSVCLSECTTAICQLIECGHEFCQPCIEQLLLDSNKCPLDTQKITEILIFDKPGGNLIDQRLIEDPDIQNYRDIFIENFFNLRQFIEHFEYIHDDEDEDEDEDEANEEDFYNMGGYILEDHGDSDTGDDMEFESLGHEQALIEAAIDNLNKGDTVPETIPQEEGTNLEEDCTDNDQVPVVLNDTEQKEGANDNEDMVCDTVTDDIIDINGIKKQE